MPAVTLILPTSLHLGGEGAAAGLGPQGCHDILSDRGSWCCDSREIQASHGGVTKARVGLVRCNGQRWGSGPTPVTPPPVTAAPARRCFPPPPQTHFPNNQVEGGRGSRPLFSLAVASSNYARSLSSESRSALSTPARESKPSPAARLGCQDQRLAQPPGPLAELYYRQAAAS